MLRWWVQAPEGYSAGPAAGLYTDWSLPDGVEWLCWMVWLAVDERWDLAAQCTLTGAVDLCYP